MKTGIKDQVLLFALISVLGLILAERAGAQTFTTLHYFGGGVSDGGLPDAGLILSGNTLYGTTAIGGTDNDGTVFSINIPAATANPGTGFTILYSFTDGNDGDDPGSALVLSADGKTLYGTAHGGGMYGYGTVFSINIAAATANPGTGFETLYSFTGGADGSQPYAGLILAGSTLYGTATSGGSSPNVNGNGTVFSINIPVATANPGTGFTTLYTFTGGNDGKRPYGKLVLSANGNTLYGTTLDGGMSGYGTVYAAKTDGSTVAPLIPLYTFTGGADGANSDADLALSADGKTLYGTTEDGGGAGNGAGDGTVFAVETDGSTVAPLTPLYTFTGGAGGSSLAGGVILSGSTLYGTTVYGGSAGNGTLFSINVPAATANPGTGFTLYSFPGTGGSGPNGDLILSGNTLYGTTEYGGGLSDVQGTVFSFSLAGDCVPPPANLVLWLPFDELTGPSAGNMAPVFDKQPGTWVGSPVPVVGQYVANSLQFFGSQYVDVADYPEINIGTNDLTIDAWVYTTNSNSPPSVIVDKRDTLGTGYGYTLAISYGRLVLQLAGPPGGTFVNYEDSSSSLVTPNQWVFVAVSVHQDPNPANSLASFYVNGAPTSATPLSPGQTDVSNTHDLWVGAGILSGNQPWQGYLDEVEVFDRALMAAEIQSIYNAGAAGKCKPCCYLNPSPLAISMTVPGFITLTWNGCGTLEESPSLTGPWTVASTTSPFTVAPSGSALFFQLTCP